MNVDRQNRLTPQERLTKRLKPNFKSSLVPATGQLPSKQPAAMAPGLLMNKHQHLMISWSAKSACTTAYVWFAYASGFGPEVTEYSSWPHDHRIFIYEKSSLKREALLGDASGLNFLKIIRDPYDRAVSIYRHALQTRFADPIFAKEKGKKLNTSHGFSFSQFLGFLAGTDLQKSDIHFRPQFHPVERVRVPDFVINISKQNMFAELNNFERKYGMPETDFHAMHWLHAMEGKRKASQDAIEGDNLEDLVLNFRDVTIDKKFPSYAQLLSAGTRRKIEQLYAIDFVSYRDVL